MVYNFRKNPVISLVPNSRLEACCCEHTDSCKTCSRCWFLWWVLHRPNGCLVFLHYWFLRCSVYLCRMAFSLHFWSHLLCSSWSIFAIPMFLVSGCHWSEFLDLPAMLELTLGYHFDLSSSRTVQEKREGKVYKSKHVEKCCASYLGKTLKFKGAM